MQNNFNFIAPFYDTLSQVIFGNSIRESQGWLLQFIPPSSKVLILGGGTGLILAELFSIVKPSGILYLEASEKMLALSRKQYEKCRKTGDFNIQFRLGTERDILPSETFDVVFTGYLLDLFKPEPLNELMFRLNSALKQNGIWLLADFAPENSTGFRQKLLFKTMVKFFKLTANLQADAIPELKPLFENYEFRQLYEKYFYRKLIRSAVYKK